MTADVIMLDDRRKPTLEYNGIQIRTKGDDMLCLTDLWRVADRPGGKKPGHWLRWEKAQSFVQHQVAVSGKGAVEHLLEVTQGRNGSVFAHWQIGYHYASYLSPILATWIYEVARERMQWETPPGPLGAGLAGATAKLDALEAKVNNNQAKNNEEIAALKEQFEKANDRFDELERHRRKKISEPTKRLVTADTHLIHKGRCPCCGMVDVVDPDGRKMPNAEFDHFFAASMPDPEHVWLICTDCHGELTTSKMARRTAQSSFDSFQNKRARLHRKDTQPS